MSRRTWIKIYCDKWLRGTLREENPKLRGIWIDVLALSGDSAYGDNGVIKLGENIGLTDEQIYKILGITSKEWEEAKQRLIKTDRIKVLNNNIIQVINWKKYQSEYERQKSYRPKLQNRVTKNPSPSISISPSISFNKEKKEFNNITDENKKLWSEAYPACNIDLELKRMVAWIIANPKKGKKSNYERFITNWLNSNQDKGGTKGVKNGSTKGSASEYSLGEEVK